jgi:hypothetical protein
MPDPVIPGLDYVEGPYGKMPDGRWRTCHHCGTVARALALNVPDCECPCHILRVTITDKKRGAKWKKTTS